MASDVSRALDRAAADGISAAHYDMVFLKPIDTSILEEAARSGAPVITVEDGTVNGGLGGAVAEWFAANAPEIEVTRLGIPDRFITQGTPAELKHLCGYDSDAIYDAVRSKARHKTTGK